MRGSRARRQCSTRFDGDSTAPLCGRDAVTRDVAREAGRRGGGAEFEAAAPIPSFTRGGTRVAASPTRPRSLLLGTVIKSQDARTVSQDAGPSQAMRLRLVTQECGETREQCRRTPARLRPSGYVMSRRSVVRCLGGVSAHRLPNTLKIGLGRVDSLETRHFMSTHFFPLPDGGVRKGIRKVEGAHACAGDGRRGFDRHCADRLLTADEEDVKKSEAGRRN